ncbi:zf-TFIIB domain-containing protein [Saccharomonospora piscinae]|uniref:Transcriptional regulator n=1 Tax=Saccharomonospora piscinae TaxID=687388 RepID=A0A1V9A280_SACPI|nr:zf-TFIIB domain-containing protein [Saccharomonospora piscinae]OQO91249.1 transcriptional regulator [Saccharomonospora piscinae]TLW93612.1 transcriptional regulator [Saccharomonospora piscinae]
MICPKCQNVMTTVDKNGVHLEQCGGCRGIFLDRGELEQIVNAENSFYASAPPPPYSPGSHPPPPPAAPGPPPTQHYGRGYDDSPKPYRGGHGGYGAQHSGRYDDSPRPYHGGYRDSPGPYGHGRKRKRSFLEGLFD